MANAQVYGPSTAGRAARAPAPSTAANDDAAPVAIGGMLRWLLRLEGAALFLAATIMYGQSGFGWGTFALYFLAPDVALLAYLAGNRVGAIVYNATHSTVAALGLFSAGLLLVSPELEVAGLIWCAHIGFDRALGYGLKATAGFEFTHLGRIGGGARRDAADRELHA